MGSVPAVSITFGLKQTGVRPLVLGARDMPHDTLEISICDAVSVTIRKVFDVRENITDKVVPP